MVQEARSGVLRGRGRTGEYTLTLRPERFVTVFADRPQRRAWNVGTSRFVRAWKALGFEQDPPNAALEVSDAPEDRDLMILTLSDPVFDEDSATLTYAVTQESRQEADLAAFQRRADDRVGASFGHASLFIDDAGAPNSDGWSQACRTYRGSPNTSGYIWHCNWPSFPLPNGAVSAMAQKCPGSFNYNQAKDASCITP